MLRIVLLCTLISVISATQSCLWPPSQWCDTADIASRCGAFDACLRNFWSKREVPRDAPKVAIGLYYETLCPGCREFITGQLAKAVGKVLDIMDVDLVPYGNAREKQDGDSWIYTCQHGPIECLGNTIEACAMYVLKDFQAYFPYINCIETADIYSDVEGPAKKCAQQLGVDYTPIDVCAKGKLGNSLQHLLALKTEKQHQEYVPWITLNGVHSDDVQTQASRNLIRFVCNNYQGTKPPACSQMDEDDTGKCMKL